MLIPTTLARLVLGSIIKLLYFQQLFKKENRNTMNIVCKNKLPTAAMNHEKSFIDYYANFALHETR